METIPKGIDLLCKFWVVFAKPPLFSIPMGIAYNLKNYAVLIYAR